MSVPLKSNGNRVNMRVWRNEAAAEPNANGRKFELNYGCICLRRSVSFVDGLMQIPLLSFTGPCCQRIIVVSGHRQFQCLLLFVPGKEGVYKIAFMSVRCLLKT